MNPSVHLSVCCMLYKLFRPLSLLEFMQTRAAGYLSSLISSLIPLLSKAQAIQAIPITLL